MQYRIKLAGLLALLLPWMIAAQSRAGKLIVTDAWSRPTPPAAKVGAVYFSIVNTGNKADRLVALSTPIATKIELHESQIVHGVIEMHAVASVECPPGATVAASPNGLHAMLLGLARPLEAGTAFSVSMQFRDAGVVTVPVTVRTEESTVVR